MDEINNLLIKYFNNKILCSDLKKLINNDEKMEYILTYIEHKMEYTSDLFNLLEL